MFIQIHNLPTSLTMGPNMNQFSTSPRIQRFLMTTFLASWLLSLMTAAEAQDATATLDRPSYKSTTPEVQTAKWAQSWWSKRHAQKKEDLKQLARVDLLMLGDSITHSWENGGKATWDQFYAARNPFNLGFSGDRTENVLWRLRDGAVDGMDPKLVVLMIGTNNAGHRQDPPKQIAAGIEAIVDELHKRLPNAKVLLLAIFPRGATQQDTLRKINDATNGLIQPLASRPYVEFLDINQVFLEEDGSLPKRVMPDLLHPNAEGYRMWAEAMEPTIKRLLQEN